MSEMRKMELPGWSGLEAKARLAEVMERGDWFASLASRAGACGSEAVAKNWGAAAVEAYKKAAAMAETLAVHY